MKRTLWGWVMLLVLAPLTLAFGQSASTSLRGVVKDSSGALVAGAKVTLVDSAKGATFSATSGSTGLYVFAQIPPAHYMITVSAAGFGDQSKTAELLVNQPATIDFAMSVQTSTVTVDVSASAQTINTTDATIGNSVANEMIVTLPLDGREPAALLSLQPGVLFMGQKPTGGGDDGRQGAVSGSRSDQSTITIDGIDDNDQANGYAFQGVLRSTLDSTEEFRVTTSNANSDAGHSSGAQVSLVTKSGTNKFHGSLYEYHRPTNTVANDWFLKQSQVTTSEENRPNKYVQNVFGGAVSGPIWKDKLFFFYNYEGQRIATNEAVTQTVPTASFLNDKSLRYYDKEGNIQTINTDQITTLDMGCTLCSAPGVNADMMTYLSTEPVANGTSEGDNLNFGSFVFSSPAPRRFNTNIAKIDYNLNSKNHVFARGNLQKDVIASDEQFPGQPAQSNRVDNSKGMVFGHTWTPTASMVNDIRYGYIRQGYADAGIGSGEYVIVRFLTQPTAQTRSTILSIPVHTITDTFTYNRGNQTFMAGGSWHMITVNTNTDSNSYSQASTNPYWLGGDPPDPTTLGLPAVADGFSNDYAIAYSTIVGNVPQLTRRYNYQITSATSATLLDEGAFIDRHFRSNEFEYFLQDSWRVTPKLTLTVGMHHSFLQTPYETKGQQIAPTVDTHQWFLDRAAAAAVGQVNQPDLVFAPNGKVNGKPGFWPKQKLNIAPRVSIAYALDSKTSIRAGAGLYFDHFGESMSQRLSTNASFGLSTSITNSAAVYKYKTAPRFTGGHDLPNISLPSADTTESYPYTYPEGNGAIVWGVDNRLKTPYTESFDLSVQRELPGGFTMEVTYLGRMGRHLMQNLDLAEPVDYVDPKGAGDYYTAGAELSKDADAGYKYVQTIPYFENVFPQMQNYEYNGESATQAIYNLEWAPNRYSWGATQSIYDLDYDCADAYGCPGTTQPRFWQPQFASLYAKSSIGMSYYNAAQLVLRHPTTHGLNMDFSYTLSKSIDMGSDVERAGYGYGAIQNSFRPELNRAVSDFDTRHLITADWAYALPFGRGTLVAANANHLVDTIIGGWQWSGLLRLTSGLPFSVNEPGFTTNWELEGWGVQTEKVKVHKHVSAAKDSGWTPQVFADQPAILDGVYSGSPIRLPYPGEAGQRNAFRGDGYFNIDSSLNKGFGLGEYGRLRFAWDVFNVTNSVRFDPYSISTTLTSTSLGKYSSEMGGSAPFRHMQFSLRYDF